MKIYLCSTEALRGGHAKKTWLPFPTNQIETKKVESHYMELSNTPIPIDAEIVNGSSITALYRDIEVNPPFRFVRT